MPTDKDDAIKATEMFVITHTPREIAEYIVNLQSALDGLSENVKQYMKAYAELYNTKHP